MNKITKEHLESIIKEVNYINPGVSLGHTNHDLNRFTSCFLTLKNGFIVEGFSSCVSLSNYSKELGEQYSYEDAFKKLWLLEGYLLKEKIYQEGEDNKGFYLFKKISNNQNVITEDLIGTFLNKPVINNSFRFSLKDSSRLITTSPVKEITSLENNKGFKIKTLNSEYLITLIE